MPQKNKILVLGGSGFLGTKFLELSLKKFKIFSTYLNKPTKIKNIEEFQLNLLNFKKSTDLIKKLNPQTIFYTARLDPLDKNPKKVKQIMEKLINFIKNQNIRFIYMSTDAVFDGKKGGYKESDSTDPATNYGLGKKITEDIIKKTLNNFIIIRTSYIYGKNKFGFDKRTCKLLEEIKIGKDVHRFSDMFRSPTLVDDLAKNCWKLIETDFCGTIHLSGKKSSILNFSRQIAKNLGYNPIFIKSNSLKNSNNNFAPDTSLNTNLAKKIINFNLPPLDKPPNLGI